MFGCCLGDSSRSAYNVGSVAAMSQYTAGCAWGAYDVKVRGFFNGLCLHQNAHYLGCAIEAVILGPS